MQKCIAADAVVRTQKRAEFLILLLLLLLLPMQVDLALRDMQERKAASAANSIDEEVGLGQAAQASLDLTDSMSEGLRIRSEMQRAVQEERYGPVWSLLWYLGCG